MHPVNNSKQTTSVRAIGRGVPRAHSRYTREAGGRMIAATRSREGVAWGRKVRTPQGSVPDNVRDGGFKPSGRPVQQRTNRQAARASERKVRVKRCGKSAPGSA